MDIMTKVVIPTLAIALAAAFFAWALIDGNWLFFTALVGSGLVGGLAADIFGEDRKSTWILIAVYAAGWALVRHYLGEPIAAAFTWQVALVLVLVSINRRHVAGCVRNEAYRASVDRLLAALEQAGDIRECSDQLLADLGDVLMEATRTDIRREVCIDLLDEIFEERHRRDALAYVEV